MNGTVIVAPSSGDKTATLYTSSSAKSIPLGQVESGKVLNVLGISNNFYVVKNKPAWTPTKGGDAMTGMIIASPSIEGYKTDKCRDVIGTFNNGTTIEILDTTNPRVYKIKGLCTNGEVEAYVETTYIYRDNVDIPPISPMSRMQRIAPTISYAPATSGTPTEGTIKVAKSLFARSGPGVSNPDVGGFYSDAKVTIHESKNGWYKVSGSNGWGNMSNVWVSGSYVQVDKTETQANIPTTDTSTVNEPPKTPPRTPPKITLPDAVIGTDEYYSKLIDRYLYALGTPPRYNQDIDLQYMNDVFPGAGRVWQKTIFSNANYLTICPGRIEVFPDLTDAAKSGLLEDILGVASAPSIISKINADNDMNGTSRMYTFHSDTENYANYLNTLCRSVSIMLGIPDEILTNTGTKHRYFDYTYWALRKKYNAGEAAAADPNAGIFAKWWGKAFSGGVSGLLQSAISDDAYLNFFLNSSETSVSESIANSVEASPLQGMFDTASDAGAKLNYFTGSGFNMSMDDATAYINSALDVGDELSNIAKAASNILKGGRMILPKMLSDSSYGKSVDFNLKFVSPYGDKRSIFYKCLIPLCHLLALALPKQIGDSMYTYPFIIRGGQIGAVNFDTAVITNLSITKGGGDQSLFTVDNIATEWDVQIEITPLIEDLMITSIKNPFLFIKNEGLLDYLSNMCGFDMISCNIKTKMEFFKTAASSAVLDIPDAAEHRLSDKLYDAINRYTTLGN